VQRHKRSPNWGSPDLEFYRNAAVTMVIAVPVMIMVSIPLPALIPVTMPTASFLIVVVVVVSPLVIVVLPMPIVSGTILLHLDDVAIARAG
jgi:hypothetical protein